MYLETRFEQLRVACDLELWQEAFRSVEDIQVNPPSPAPLPRRLASVPAPSPGPYQPWRRA